MYLNTTRTASRNSLNFKAEITRSEMNSVLVREFKDIVIQRLVDDFYEKHSEEIFKSISTKSMLKMFYKKLEHEVSHKVRVFIKGK